MSDIKFTSQIPEHLLINETPAMQFLMNELSKNTQVTQYLLKRREESGEILDEIKAELKSQGGKLENQSKELLEIRLQTQKTNGVVLRHTKEIGELVENKEDIKQIVAAKKIAVKLGTSKLFWIVFGAAVIGLLMVFTNIPLAEFLPFLRKDS